MIITVISRNRPPLSGRGYRAFSDSYPADQRGGYIPAMASAFEVVAEPRRREILDLLRAGEWSAGALASELRLSRATMSKHLRVLREAGLVVVRPDKQRRWYSLRVEPLAEITDWLTLYANRPGPSASRLAEPRPCRACGRGVGTRHAPRR